MYNHTMMNNSLSCVNASQNETKICEHSNGGNFWAHIIILNVLLLSKDIGSGLNVLLLSKDIGSGLNVLLLSKDIGSGLKVINSKISICVNLQLFTL